jgi:DMSO/TMAO reductase YedYZ heme-binding membrane subunit
MNIAESVFSWAQSIGIGGAFFLIALCAFALSGLALWVVLIALRRDRQ